MLKAIETRYKGYRFRSRIESRYAVFMDTLGMPWEYEAEGFEIPGVGSYLPDFWLPLWQVWLEIKPIKLLPGSVEWNKAYGLAAGAHAVVVAQGNIGDERLTLFCHDSSDSSAGMNDWDAEWSFGVRGLPCALAVDTRRVLMDAEWNPLHFVEQRSVFHSRLQEAYRAARSARFEHGERGDV